MTTTPVPPPRPQPDPLTQIRDLESRFANAMTELYAVGNGLAQIRSSLSAAAGQGSSAAAAGRPQVPSGVPSTGPPTQVPPVAGPGPRIPHPSGGPGDTGAPGPTPAAIPAPRAPQPHWWERPGAVARVLGVIGAVVTLIGIALLLAIAIAAGVFGPVPRVVSGALLAVGLLAGGAIVRRRSPASPGAGALAATGLAAGYLTLLAATAVYGFVPDWLGLVLAALFAAGAFVLARAWDSELLAILAAAPPVLLAPFVSGIDSVATISFVALLLVGSAFAHLGREWGWLYLARTGPSVAILLAGVGTQADDTLPTLTVAMAACLGMVAAGWVERSRRLEHLPTAAAAASGLPVLLAVALLEDGRLAVALALAGVLLAGSALVSAIAARSGVSRSLWTAPMAVGTVLILQAATGVSDETRAGIALSVVAAGYWVVAAWRRTWPLAAAGAVLAAVSGLTFTGVLAATAFPGLATLEDPLVIVHGLLLTALAAVGLYTATAILGRRDATLTLIAAAWAFITGSATIVAAGTWLGSLAGESRVGFYGGHAVATAAWTALGAALITVVAGRSRHRDLMVRLGLGLIAVAIAKLFLFDLAALSGLFRVVAFVVTGLIVLLVGVAYSRSAEDDDSEPPPPQPESHPTVAPTGRP
ncbi:DUF2339 domain-containing protein [Nostocoides sp. F2B08]|uniref:DUF2339 domain-containing protein n=1 Tax=Nostocoides sp. F2B08 TaxID=2653936 RepID=UPI001262FEA7|nr:DUF2339 domain-containing protein [Tetrasphaera sp. F2B08]KAB7741405.1 DUF2339 domain-containing protein [Tetrasphaera sp. F2B08]